MLRWLREAREGPKAEAPSPADGGLQGLAHDLRSSLNNVLMRTHLLESAIEKEGGLTEESRDHLERIREAVQKATARIEEVEEPTDG